MFRIIWSMFNNFQMNYFYKSIPFPIIVDHAELSMNLGFTYSNRISKSKFNVYLCNFYKNSAQTERLFFCYNFHLRNYSMNFY
jgi:hypothetical protein